MTTCKVTREWLARSVPHRNARVFKGRVLLFAAASPFHRNKLTQQA